MRGIGNVSVAWVESSMHFNFLPHPLICPMASEADPAEGQTACPLCLLLCSVRPARSGCFLSGG
jgi:hypothetical protein